MLAIQGCDRRTGPPIFIGSDGIQIKFLNNAPSDIVYENQPVNVMVDVWNKGAYTPNMTEDIILNLRYDSLYFDELGAAGALLTLDPTGRIPPLAGKSDIWPQGERTITTLQVLRTREILGTREMPTTNLEAVVCYPYKTFLTQTVCLETDIFEIERNPICRNRGTYTHTSQGAPIAITKVDVDIIPVGYALLDSIEYQQVDESRGSIGYSSEFISGLPLGNEPVYDESGNLLGIQQSQRDNQLILLEPVFRIYAKNVGRGDVFIASQPNVPTYNLCSMRDFSFEFRDHNKIELTQAKLDGFDLNCSKTILNLANPSDFLSCRLSQNQTGYIRQNMQVQLLLEFSYHYRESEKTQVKIYRD